MPDPNASQLNIKVEASLDIDVQRRHHGRAPIKMAELRAAPAPEAGGAEGAATEKVVFVDFEDDGAVDARWCSAMDTIRGLATDENHDEIKVALKIKDPEKAQ